MPRVTQAKVWFLLPPHHRFHQVQTRVMGNQLALDYALYAVCVDTYTCSVLSVMQKVDRKASLSLEKGLLGKLAAGRKAKGNPLRARARLTFWIWYASFQYIGIHH